MKKILVLGATGMLGHTVIRVLTEQGFTVFGSSRGLQPKGERSDFIDFDAKSADSLEKVIDLATIDFVVNCAGVIKQKTPILDSLSIKESIYVNSIFPHLLNDLALGYNFNVIQIATDCVYDGVVGGYSEKSLHNPADVYGKTKSLGEVESKNFLNLRTSIVGQESKTKHSILSWLLSKKKGESVHGYTNHLWNGVTTFHFAKVVSGILGEGGFVNGTHHLIPTGNVSKYELLGEFCQAFSRSDLNISPFTAPDSIDRTLTTVNPELNQHFWRNAGYHVPPQISEMVVEYAQWLKGKGI